jgi:D-glycero-D-manno-heptose 1,7-bisphosphate phosphatase
VSSKALFLDRDGVINIDHGYVSRPADFEPVDGIFGALQLASSLGYKLIVITNQSGIGRGYFTQGDYNVLERHIHELFRSHNLEISGTYYCPHAPTETCECRKPLPGMILRAAREHDIDVARSVMIGDKQSDADAAHAAGVGTFKMATDEHPAPQVITALFEGQQPARTSTN